jgi:hypothetical protein
MNLLVQHGPFALLFAFLCVHALVDFPLQGDYLARQKSRKTAGSKSEWIVALTAHCLIQAGGVWLVSGCLALGGAELIVHYLIDLGKGEGKFGLVTDQLLHVACKVVYVGLLGYGVLPFA